MATKWASEMSGDAIRAEMADLHTKLVDFESADGEDKARGGSPGEGLYERWDELTEELRKRGVPFLLKSASF